MIADTTGIAQAKTFTKREYPAYSSEKAETRVHIMSLISMPEELIRRHQLTTSVIRFHDIEARLLTSVQVQTDSLRT